MSISEEQIAQLRASYVRGRTSAVASELAGVCVSTAHKQFAMFRAAGLHRGPVYRRNGTRLRFDPPRPVYTGPDWIG